MERLRNMINGDDIADEPDVDEKKSDSRFEIGLLDLKRDINEYVGNSIDDTEKGVEAPSFNWYDKNLKIGLKAYGCKESDYNDIMGMYLNYFKDYSEKPVVTRSFSSPYGPSISINSNQNTSRELTLSFSRISNLLEVYMQINEKATSKDLDFLKETWDRIYSTDDLDPEKRLNTLGVEIMDDGLHWDHIGGYERVKDDVKKTVILPLEEHDVYENITKHTRVHQKDITPKAVLFYGPPGTGKTTMGKIIAGQLDMPFVNVPVESIFTKWYGESPKRLSEIFRLAGGYDRCVLFIDEIDALTGNRDGIHEESRKVLSTLLTRMDGLRTRDGILTIGATNRYDDIDPAVKRRFDDEIYFDLPSMSDRVDILGLYCKHLDNDGISEIAGNTDSYSGSDIEKMAKDVEREYAKRIIESGVDGLPSLDLYMDYIEKKG